MQKIIALIVCWCWCCQASAQPNITAAEYFIDTDPGFGNATSIPITTPSPNITDHAFSIPLGAVPQGVHSLFIRSRNANGKWSVSNRYIFYKPSPASGTPPGNIVNAEYFFDTDPGFGNATNIPLTSGIDVQNVSFAAAINSLSVGVHNLFIRSKNADGKWSVTNRQVIYKPAVNGALASNIVKAEYFFDTDPGFGNATNIPVTPGVDVQNVNFTAGINALSVGVHSLFIRSKNADGKWSVTNRQVIYKPAVNGALASNIVKAEYFFDTDPGFGNATNIPVTPGVDVQNVNFAAGINALSVGVHSLFIRSKNADGKWSVTNRQIIYKPSPANGLPPANITNVEYFIDSDPGFSNGVPIAINPAANFSDFVTLINISGLSVGDHKLYIRSRASSGWSITNVYTFPIAATAASPFINVNAITKTVMCARDSVKISYHATGTYNPGNVFNAELSDASGSFASPVIIGSYTGINSAIISCKIPANVVGGTNFRVRVSSTNPVVTGLASSDLLTIGGWPNLGPDTTVYLSCLGETTSLNPLYTITGLTAVWNTGIPANAPEGTYQLIVTNNLGCTDTALAFIVLEVATWTGTVSSDWHTAANWNIGKVPTDKTHVIITGVTPNACIVSNANAQAASVQVRNGATMQTINNRVADIKGICVTLPPD